MAEGHITKAPATITYASDVSRETVSIAVIIAALTNLEVKLGDILYAYVQAPVTGKVRTTFSSEFGKGASKTAVIVRALYGLKSAGSAFRSRVVRCMIYLECAPQLRFLAETRNKTRWGTVLLLPTVLCG